MASFSLCLTDFFCDIVNYMKNVLIFALVMMHAAAVSAQRVIEQNFKQVINSNLVSILSKSDKTVDCLDGKSSYCKFTEFTVPGKRKQVIAQLERAITTDQANAYNVFVKKAGGNSHTSSSDYVYGARNEYSISLGSYKSHNYYGLCYKDSSDTLRRHAYCFVWYKEGTDYHCYYYHIYGVMPAKYDEYRNGDFTNLKLRPLRTSTYADGNMIVTQTYDSDGNLVRTDTAPQTSTAKEVKSDIDFMLQFGNLRAAFLEAIKDANAKVLQTGIVVKITRLCKESGRLLSDNEKRTCRNSLSEMSTDLQNANPDSFLEGMIKEARDVLSK